MQTQYHTARLFLDELKLSDADFIVELVNTPGWIKFIGDRNIKSREDAITYIQKILDNLKVNYWVVRTRTEADALGVITNIKRNYLDHPDIGFAFLPQHHGKGYAFEAALEILTNMAKERDSVLATTIKDNTSSIQLLRKLGFTFDKEIHQEEVDLMLYSVSSDKARIDNLVRKFFKVFNNTNEQSPNWELLHQICISETIIIKRQNNIETVYGLESFIEPRKKLLAEGTLTNFEEHELSEETKIIAGIAQRFTRYQKSGTLNGVYFKEEGNKFFQFIKTAAGWKINSLIWEDDT